MPDLSTTPDPTPGTRGHTRTTWDHGLRALLRRLRFDNPRASKAELQELIHGRVSAETTISLRRRAFVSSATTMPAAGPAGSRAAAATAIYTARASRSLLASRKMSARAGRCLMRTSLL